MHVQVILRGGAIGMEAAFGGWPEEKENVAHLKEKDNEH